MPRANDNIIELNAGNTAPEFSALGNGNRNFNLKDFKGKNLVLYFYPKDNTTGCTAQARDFSLHHEQFKKINAVILGVSIDGIQSHEKFIAKNELSFNLVSDKDSAIAKSYGVWVQKSMFGKKYMGTERTTFLINKDGYIAHIWRNVKVDGHAEEVLKQAKTLK